MTSKTLENGLTAFPKQNKIDTVIHVVTLGQKSGFLNKDLMNSRLASNVTLAGLELNF